MNERLEKETLRIWKDEVQAVFHNDAYAFACLQDIAQHFYNLALDDVREEVADMIGYIERLKIDSDFHSGELVVCDNILGVIDKLKK